MPYLARHVLPALFMALALGACEGAGPEAPDAGGGEDAASLCARDEECGDGLFCTGAERCAPSDPAADPRGCVPASPPCLEGQRCDEAETRCVTDCARVTDADGDGADAMDCGGDDCDDADPLAYPGAAETCDVEGRDEDCDPTTFGERDLDSDGFVDARCCNGASCGDDCDDSRRGVYPTAAEVCDHIDGDCDGVIDEDVGVPGFVDADSDGHGDAERPVVGCLGDVGFVETAGDCDDSSPQVSPSLGEACDGIDNDCDPATRDAFDGTPQPWYRDADGDGYGEIGSAPVVSCSAPGGPLGYSLASGDCHDHDGSVSPAARELCNGRDDDCDGRPNYVVGPGDFEDDDGDGVADAACGGADCDDRDWRTAPSAPELADGRDNDCDGMVDEAADPTRWYADEDGDGYGDDLDSVVSAEPVAGRVQRGGDCVPYEAAIHPGATEVCDGLDQDCDGRVDEELVVMLFPDADGDGFGDARRPAVSACAGLPGLVNDASDCDDSDARVRPGAPDLCGDLDDSDCDGRVDDRDCVRSGVLSFLHVSDGWLEPAFAPDVTSYTLHLPFTAPDVRLTPYCTGEVAGACATIDGAARADGAASAWIAADDGSAHSVAGPDGSLYTLTFERPLCRLEYVHPSARSAGAAFGGALAADGHELLIGARDASGAAGQPRAGEAYVFSVSGGVPRQAARFAPVEQDEGDRFGSRTALCGDHLYVTSIGDDAAPGMPLTDDSGMDLGLVHHYQRTAGRWRWASALQPTLVMNSFGQGLSCDRERGTVVISSPNGFVHVFDPAMSEPLTTWTGSGGALFGWSAAIGNGRVVVGEQWTGGNMGNAVIYDRVPGAATYTERQRVASFGVGPWDNFGNAVDLDGGTLVVYSRDESAVAGVHGASSPGAGTPHAACSTALEKDYGAVYVFERGATSFSLTNYIKSPSPYCQDRFGEALDLRDDLLLIGAPSEDTIGTGASFAPRANQTGPSEGGGVYLYARRHGTWLLVAHVKAGVVDALDRAGSRVALGEGFLAFSAPGDDSGGADPSDGSAADAGGVWVCTW